MRSLLKIVDVIHSPSRPAGGVRVNGSNTVTPSTAG